MRAYSMDLRERVLLDSDAGMKVGEVAPRVQRHGRRCMAACLSRTCTPGPI